MPIKGSLLISKETIIFGLALSRSEKSQLMTLITCLHWRDKGTQYLSVTTSSNPTKVVELDSTGEYR
jgi:hypothetical protein